MPVGVNVASWRGDRAIGLIFFIAPFMTLLAPRSTVIALILISACAVAIALLDGRSARDLFRFNLGLALFAVVTAYLLTSAAWALDPSRAISKSLWFAVVALMAFGGSRALCTWTPKRTRLAVIALFAGLTAGLAFILFELATDRLLTRTLFTLLPFLRHESHKGIVIRDNTVVGIALFELNRNVAVLLLLLWPALLCISRLRDKRRRLFGLVSLAIATILAIMFSEHQGSQVALPLSALVFLFAVKWPVLARRAVLTAWCLAFVLVVPLSTAALKADLHQAEWLPFSARARVILWAYTADHVADAPFLGIGLGSTRSIDQDPQSRLRAKKPEGYVFPWRAGAHAHNVFLQTWYELGGVGAVLLAAAGFWVIAGIGYLARRTQPFILAHATAFMVITAFSWGMWQSWLMALTGLAALYAALAVNAYRVSEAGLTSAADETALHSDGTA